MNGGKRPDRRHWLGAARYPARRDGAAALALFLLPAVVALTLVLRHRHLDVAAVSLLVTLSLGLPAAWFSWAGFRDSRRSVLVSGLTMAQLADKLAVAVGAQ